MQSCRDCSGLRLAAVDQDDEVELLQKMRDQMEVHTADDEGSKNKI